MQMQALVPGVPTSPPMHGMNALALVLPGAVTSVFHPLFPFGRLTPAAVLSEGPRMIRPAGIVPEPARISPGRPRHAPVVLLGQSLLVGSRKSWYCENPRAPAQTVF